MGRYYDTVVREDFVYDGSDAPPVVADVAIDARGLALSPGFIDVHTHDNFAAVLHPQMAFKRCAGVTACVVGNCGMGAAPYAQAVAATGWALQQAYRNRYIQTGGRGTPVGRFLN